jgi:hypothetical protein
MSLRLGSYLKRLTRIGLRRFRYEKVALIRNPKTCIN